MSSPDPEYYARRAIQERNQAATSRDPYARRLHAELARRYGELAEEPVQEPMRTRVCA